MSEYKAYRVITDSVVLPRALFRIGETANGDTLYDTDGILYENGQYVLGENIAPNIRERIEDGKLEWAVEEVDREEAEAAINGLQFGVFSPEHAVERQALEDYGHSTISRDDAIELRSDGSEAVAQAQEALKEDGAAERPNLTPIDDETSTGDVSLDQARESGLQVTASGVKAQDNPFAKPRRSRSASASSEEGGESAAAKKKRLAAEKKAEQERVAAQEQEAQRVADEAKNPDSSN